jgi:zinc finger BED domain-containing protein 1 (E3 SUMO-protein ligase ZBED1)
MNGKIFHQKCACHILHLTIKACIKTQGVNALIMKFKNSLHHIFSNNIRKQEFHALCAWLGLSKLRVSWDVDTRWNSTYRMFHRCFPYKHAITETLNNSTERIHLLIFEGEWDQLEMLKSFLGVFFTATVKLSCSYAPSARMHHLHMSYFIIFIAYPR